MIRKSFFINLLVSMVVITGLSAGDNAEIGNSDGYVITVTTHGRRCFLMARFRMPEDRSYAREFYRLAPGNAQTISITSHRQRLEGITVFARIGGRFSSVNAPVARHYDVRCTEDGLQVDYS